MISPLNISPFGLKNVGVNDLVIATGGTITTDGDYRIHTFTSDGTFEITYANPLVTTMAVLAVGGGGSGGGYAYGGGGGGGEVVYDSSYALAVQSYAVTVGLGGIGDNLNPAAKNNGGSSIFGTITATGGGAGGGFNQSGNNAVNGGDAGDGVVIIRYKYK